MFYTIFTNLNSLKSLNQLNSSDGNIFLLSRIQLLNWNNDSVPASIKHEIWFLGKCLYLKKSVQILEFLNFKHQIFW